MVLQIISWYKFFVRRIDGLTKTSKLQLKTRPTITAIALLCLLQGYLAHKKLPPPKGHHKGPRHGPTAGS